MKHTSSNRGNYELPEYVQCEKIIERIINSTRDVGTPHLDPLLKDRQLLMVGVLRCSPFLCIYFIYIHVLYKQSELDKVARGKPIFSLLFFEQGYLA